MTTLADLTLENANKLQKDFNQRGYTVVRQCGEEHTGQATSGIATVYLPTDPEMAYISQYRFKFIVGNPNGESVPQFDPQYNSFIDPVNITGQYASVTAFYDTHLGKKIDMDGSYGAQCLTAGSMVLMADKTYRDVAELKPGDVLWGGKVVCSNRPRLSDAMRVRTNIGTFTSTPTHILPLANGDLTQTQYLNEGISKLDFDGDADDGETYKLTDDELRFLGFYLGSGVKKYHGKKNEMPGIFINTTQNKKYLAALDINTIQEKHPDNFKLVNNSHPLLMALIHQIDGKNLPQSFTSRQYELIIEGLISSVGCGTADNQEMVPSPCKGLLVSIQHGCLSLGWTARISELVNAEYPGMWALTIDKNELLDEVVVKSVERLSGSQTVYVLNITDDHLYYADNIMHHNCWDLADVFWEKMAGRRLITQSGGNGTAAMCWTVSREANRTDSTGRVIFDAFSTWAEIRPGDWLVFSGPASTGHITMALEKPTSATAAIACLGQNQRNANLQYGSAASVDNFNSAYFLGAFRWEGVWDTSSPYDAPNNRPRLA